MADTFVAPNIAAFGCWTSPIAAANLTKGAIVVLDVKVVDGRIYRLENLPNKDGRLVVMTVEAEECRRLTLVGQSADWTRHCIAAIRQSGNPVYEPLRTHFDQRLRPALITLPNTATTAGTVRTDLDAEELLGAVASCACPRVTTGQARHSSWRRSRSTACAAASE